MAKKESEYIEVISFVPFLGTTVPLIKHKIKHVQQKHFSHTILY